MSHTRGPWRVRYTKGQDWQIITKDGYNVTGIPEDDYYGRPTEDAANARLIAAAPALLAVVIKLHRILEREGGEVGCVGGILRAAELKKVIRRAEGRK